MELLLGKPVVEKIKEELINKIALKKRKPCLSILLNQDDESSLGYVNALERLAKQLSIKTIIERVKDKNQYIELIDKINKDSNIDACLITRPLVNNAKEKEILSLLNPQKDVDSLNYQSLGKILVGDERFVPNTALAIIKMIEYYHIDVEGKKVLVIGRSLSVGKPVALLLMNRNATVTIAHSRTKNLNEELANYDIVIGALGKPHFIDSNFMKKGSVALDAGIHYLEKGIIGDILPSENVSQISKVPGGIGPITSICLMQNVLSCYEENSHDY